jgi:hypothetical protein
MMRKIFLILIVVATVVLAKNAGSGKKYWANKPFVVQKTASKEYNVRTFIEVDLKPVINHGNGVSLRGEAWVKDDSQPDFMFGPYNHGTDVVLKKLEKSDIIPFCDFMHFKNISKDSLSANFSFDHEGYCNVYVLSRYAFSGEKKYRAITASVKSKGPSLIIDSIVYFSLMDNDSLWVHSCYKEKCNIYTSKICRGQDPSDCSEGNSNQWIYRDFSVRPLCDWIKFSPLEKSHKGTGVITGSLGFLYSSKEGTCKIEYVKGGVKRTTDVVSVRQGDYFHLYQKSQFRNGVYPPYPEKNIVFDLIDIYLQENRNMKNNAKQSINNKKRKKL